MEKFTLTYQYRTKMKKILILVLFTMISCNKTNCKSDIKSIQIFEDQSSEIDLFKGTYIVHFMNKQDSILKFSISEKEMENIKKLYLNNDICLYGNNVLIQEKDPLIMPATELKYVIEFENGKQQNIMIRTDFRKDPLNIKGNEKMKIFIDNINRNLNNKNELKNKPKSDIFKM